MAVDHHPLAPPGRRRGANGIPPGFDWELTGQQ